MNNIINLDIMITSLTITIRYNLVLAAQALKFLYILKFLYLFMRPFETTSDSVGKKYLSLVKKMFYIDLVILKNWSDGAITVLLYTKPIFLR